MELSEDTILHDKSTSCENYNETIYGCEDEN